MTNTKTFKKILLISILILAFIFGQNAYFFSFLTGYSNDNMSNNEVSVNAESFSNSGHSEPVSTLLTDNTFNASNGSSYPLKSAYWTSTESNSSIYSGVIDISNLTQSNCSSCGLEYSEIPPLTGASEEKVLMINSDSSAVSQGYSSNDGVELSAGSFYSISFNVWTDNDAFASIYLSGTNLDGNDNSKITPIQTNKQWQSYTFWIATSNISNQSVGIELYLGTKKEGVLSPAQVSRGMVLFDNIIIQQYSQNLFEDRATETTRSKIIDLRTDIVNQSAGQDGYVESDFSKWTDVAGTGNAFANIVDLNTYSGSNGQLTDITPGTNYGSLIGAKAIAFSAEDGFRYYQSNDITIKRNTIYRISFWAKGNISSGAVYAQIQGDDLTSTDPDAPNYQTASFASLSNTESKFTNNWTQYCFYVTGNPLSDTTANLFLGIGSTDQNATGYVFFAGITSQIITSEQKARATSIGQNQSLDIYPTAELNFTNGLFNYIESDSDSSTPDAPTNWTHDQANENENIQYGVINIDPEEFGKYSLGNDITRPDSNAKHNVLYLRNNSPTYQGYYNDTSVTLDATSTSTTDSGYYKFSIDVQTQIINNSRSGAFVYLKDANDNTLIWFKVRSDTSTWQTYTVYIKSYFSTSDITPYLYLGSENEPTTGIAFFDNCRLVSSTASEFDEAIVDNETIYKLNLTTDTFDSSVSTQNNVGSPAMWKGTLDPNSLSTCDVAEMAGIINTNNLDGTPVYASPTTTKNENLLFIYADNDSYYYFTNKLPYTLTAESYYKLTVSVKTILLSQNQDNALLADDSSTIPYGASIIVNGIEGAQFTGIDTTPTDKDGNKVTYSSNIDAFNDENNQFVEYVMYFCPSEDTEITVQLALGSLDAMTSGFVFFDNFTLENITGDTYNNEMSEYESEDDYPENIISLVNATTNAEDTEETYDPNFDWVAIPTVIIAIAVVVAVVGFSIKRLREKRAETVSVSTNYDRVETLLKDVSRRDRANAINQKLRNLNEELAMTEKFLKEETEEFKKEQEEYATAQEIASDTGIEIEGPEREEKDHAKTIEQLNENIVQIKRDIEILEMEKAKIKKQEEKDIQKARKDRVIKKRK